MPTRDIHPQSQGPLRVWLSFMTASGKTWSVDSGSIRVKSPRSCGQSVAELWLIPYPHATNTVSISMLTFRVMSTPAFFNGPMLTLLTLFCCFFTTLSAQKVTSFLHSKWGCEKEAPVCEDACWTVVDIDKASVDKKDELRHFPYTGSG